MTVIREIARRAGRYELEVGGGTIGPISTETIAGLRLAVGRELDETMFARLQSESAITACFDRALGALARRSRASKDLERWLVQREHPRAAIAAAISRLEALGLLDDARFAHSFVAARSGSRIGPRRLVLELRRRGVADSIIDAEVRAWRSASGDQGLGDLEIAAERRLRSLGSLEPTVARRRLLGWLLRRGFDPGPSADVARRLIPGR